MPSPDASLSPSDAVLARKMWRTLEPVHGMIYFAPHAASAYAELGVKGQSGYFASRAAAMGAVPADVVIATFYNFHPAVVREAIPMAWEKAAPPRWIEARTHAADLTLREVLGDDALGSPEMAEAARLARRAAEACTPEGRPLYAAHASLPWPDDPHLALWHAITLLREYRGDGHLAALVLEDLDGCEALLTHGAAGDNLIPLHLLKQTRRWPDDEWAAGQRRLADRGILGGDDLDQLTDLGNEIRQRIEDNTDRCAMAPWLALGQDDADHLRELVRPFSKAISESGVFLNRPT